MPKKQPMLAVQVRLMGDAEAVRILGEALADAGYISITGVKANTYGGTRLYGIAAVTIDLPTSLDVPRMLDKNIK